MDRIKEDKRREAAYQQALERHKAEMEKKKANEIKRKCRVLLSEA